MLTKEQIADLNPGQTLQCQCSFVATEDYGNRIVVDMCYAGRKERETSRISYFYEQLSLPPTKPKHDPCRLFKSGDIVEMDTHGRDIAASMKKSGVELGKRYTVTEDENNTGYVSFIGDDGIEHHSMFFWLKLVTPVEELEPYNVHETEYLFRVMQVVEGGEQIVSEYRKSTHPHAKEAAEDERDRLNAEWRKEHGHDA